MTTLMIDNYDSFTYNIYQYLAQLGANVHVARNDKITLQECIDLNPINVVISPGPGHPREAGVSEEVIRHFAGKVPVLGICLGMQTMFEMYGGTVGCADEIMHGKVSPMLHDGKGVFRELPDGFNATRYHSLVGFNDTLPQDLVVTCKAKAKDQGKPDLIMGVRHRKFTVEGLQFHPESVTTENGMEMLRNFLLMKGGEWKQGEPGICVA